MAHNVGAYLESALAAQRSFMEVYGDTMEQMLNFLVYLVPMEEDEEENDMAGYKNQAVFSLIELFGLYRTVLLRSPDALPIATLERGQAEHTVECSQSARLRRDRMTYTVAAFVLRAVRSVQVLVEMQAQRVGGLRCALRVCLRVEAVKLALRLVLRSRMPFALYVDDEAIEEVEPSRASTAGGVTAAPSAPTVGGAAETFVGMRSGRRLPALPSPRAPAKLRASDASAAARRIAIGELLFHGRPLLHLLALLRRGRQSWTAWFVPLVLDVLSLGLLSPCLRARPGSRASTLEAAELRRRRGMLWWALARSPFFDQFLQRPTMWLDAIVSRIPIINLFHIVDIALALRRFHFTTSAS